MSALSLALGSHAGQRGADDNPRSIVEVPNSSTTDTMDLAFHSPPTRGVGAPGAGLVANSTGTSSSFTNSCRVSPSGLASSAKRYSLQSEMASGTPPSSLDNAHLPSPKQLPLHVPLRTSGASPFGSLSITSATNFSLNNPGSGTNTPGASVSLSLAAGTGSSPSPYYQPHSLSHRSSPAAGPISTAGRRRYSNSSNSGYPKSSPSTSLLSTAPSVPSSLHDSYGVGGPNRSSAAGGPLNANSPLALAAAAQVTPDKLSRLLLTQGPLAIRHITSHLALTITGFADLSSSKQRRLIIAVLDSGDSVNNVVFEKISWGRWAARKLDHKLLSKEARRQSISSGLYNSRPPVSPVLKPQDGLKSGHINGFIRRSSYNTQHKSGLSSWAVDDVDLADDDMMFHNSTHKARGSITRTGPSGRVFEDDIDDVAIVSDEEDEEDDEEDDSDEFGFHTAHGAFNPSRTRQPAVGRPAAETLVGGRRPGGGDTDEEDWQSVGAEGLRGNPIPIGKREQEAIDALVQLRSI